MQLEQMQGVLQEVAQQANHNAHRDQSKVAQARYWNTVGGLIDEVLRLSQHQTEPPPLKRPEVPDPPPLAPAKTTQRDTTAPTPQQLSAHLFGKFKASLNGCDINRWPRGKGLKILKFLLLYRSTPISRERLMETFWPDTDTHAARNNLNVALYHLRQDLSRYHKSFPFVHYRDGYYQLNTELSTWVDVEAFDQHLRVAQQHDARHETTLAISAYRDAEALYQGDCLEDDLPEDWAALISQAYRLKYLGVLEYLGAHTRENGDYQECALLWQKAVTLDSCNEQAHQRIMYCYWQMGQRQMALRQYQICEENLQKELGLEPTQQTRQLLAQIRQTDR
jgi:DNA-binding SARP family transcriptional activator